MLGAVTLSEAKKEGRRRRHLRFVAALEAADVTQADLVRFFALAGDKTNATTVNGWFLDRSEIDADTLDYVLRLLGLPADWQPAPSTPTPQ